MNTADVPTRVIVASAKLTSRSSAATTGAAARIAELPQIVDPTPISTATRPRTPNRRPIRIANAHPPPIVTSTNQNALEPISETDCKSSQSPSRMIPNPST